MENRLQRFEVYGFNARLGWSMGLGWLKESFNNEDDANTFSSLMNKNDRGVVYKIKKVSEEWLS